MKLYKPVKIESAEQAEALPDGTVTIREGHFAREKRWRGWYDTDVEEWGHADMVGWTALVPIEAEEETCSVQTRGQISPEWRTRYFTPWTKEDA